MFNNCNSNTNWEECFEKRKTNWFLNVINNIQYCFWRIFNFFKYLPKEIYWFCQRGFKGFSDKDLWNLGYHVLYVLKEGTKSLKEHHIGNPIDIKDKEWTKILSEIEKGCDAGLKIYSNFAEVLDENGKFVDYRSFTKTEMKTMKKEYNKAMSLLKKFCFNLWN
jgi:hypothetical protein